jgi:hypothetical protein
MTYPQQTTESAATADETAPRVKTISIAPSKGERNLIAAYLLWFFFGVVGGHRFYVGRTRSALVMLTMTLVSWGLYASLVGSILAVPITVFVGVWWFTDAFRIPSWTSVSAAIASITITEK